nr:hypothetical protein [Tanacetum cinerariifolium]
METTITASPTPTLRIHKDHPKSQIISPVDTPIQTKNKSKKNVWTLVDYLKWVRPIKTKWVLKNKKDERGIVIKNKARLVAQRHTQEEGIDYDEVFAPVARIKAIRLFLAYASFMGFIVYQMDVKSAFLYGTIDEEVRQRGDFILVQVYVDDIIFGSQNPQLCREFEALMHEKLQMSAMGELNFVLGLQVLQKEDGIFLSQDKYVGDILKKFGYSDVRSANTPMDKENPWVKMKLEKMHQVTPKECHLHAVKRIFRYLKGHPKLGLWYRKESPFDLVAYSDSDYGGATQDRKSTTGGCQFLGRRLISWQCKKQIIVATSTTEFCDYHNMVAILEKSEHNVDFHPIVDFIKASPLRIETTEEGTKILATVDGILRTVTESSLRRNLKLKDEEGISSLPDAEHSPSFSCRIVPLFDSMLTLQGKGLGTPTEPHHTPSPMAQQTLPTTHSSLILPPVTTALIPTVTISDTPLLRQYTRRTRIAQSSVLLPVADEPAYPFGDGSQGEACPTDSGFVADQDRANITKTSTLPSDLAPRVTSFAADEGSMQQKLDELTALCISLQRQHSAMVAKFEAQELEINSLKARIKVLEDREGGFVERSGDYAPIKGRRLDVREEVAERVSYDTEEMATVLTSMDAAIVLSSRVAKVPTGSGSIPTTGLPATEVPTCSDVVPTAGPNFCHCHCGYSLHKKKRKRKDDRVKNPKEDKDSRVDGYSDG